MAMEMVAVNGHQPNGVHTNGVHTNGVDSSPQTTRDFTVGIIGMGEMGKVYARRINAAGFRINACDLPSKYEELKAQFADKKGISIFPNGHLVSRDSDYIIYCVEAALIDRIVGEYGPSTKVGAIVGGQTSCKAPELRAFDKHLPPDVDVVSCHSLHGPGVDPKGQPLVIVRHRASQKSMDLVMKVFENFQAKVIYLTGEQHDRVTADTQAVTHVAFMSMGSAWAANKQFPWEIDRYVGGIENAKINITLRIYSNKWHVYAGLAILNPAAGRQIREYARSVTELFKLMLGGHRDELERRVKAAGSVVFHEEAKVQDLLLRDEFLDQFSLAREPKGRMPNNHLSLLAMVDCWWRLGIVPYDHMICSTPIFRIWLGVTEYLFRTPGLVDEVIDVAINDDSFRSDDLEFTFAARAWSDCVSFGNFEAYRARFDLITEYFHERLPDAVRMGNEMIETIMEKTLEKEKSREQWAEKQMSRE